MSPETEAQVGVRETSWGKAMQAQCQVGDEPRRCRSRGEPADKEQVGSQAEAGPTHAL